MPCFARLCECVRCFARKHSIYIYIIYTCPALQGCANVHLALQGYYIYINYIILYIYICLALQGCANVLPVLQGNVIHIHIDISM